MHLSIDNGCILHLLAIVNSAAVNMGVQIFEAMLSLLQGIYSEVGLLDHMVILFLILWRAIIPFSTAATPFCISINDTQSFQFLHSLVSSCYFLFFKITTIPISMKCISLWFLICNSLITSSVEYLFMCLLAQICVCSLEKCLLKSFEGF